MRPTFQLFPCGLNGRRALSPELLLLISLFPRKDLPRARPTRGTAGAQNKAVCWPHAARVQTWEDMPGSNGADAYDSDKCSRTMRQGRRCERQGERKEQAERGAENPVGLPRGQRSRAGLTDTCQSQCARACAEPHWAGGKSRRCILGFRDDTVTAVLKQTLTDAESVRNTDTQTAVAEWHGCQAGTSGKESPQNALTHSGRGVRAGFEGSAA